MDLRNMKNKKPKISQILTTKFEKYNIYSLIVKDRFYDSTSVESIKIALQNLKKLLIKQKNHSFRKSRKGDYTEDLGPGLLTELSLNTFDGNPITVTVCYGKAAILSKDERLNIIQTLHDSLIGGNKEINQTYQKIRLRYYWSGMRNDMTDYVRKIPQRIEKKVDRHKTR